MSPTIGKSVEPERGSQLIGRARARAALIPDLLTQAQRVANTVFAGWHGRKRRGTGEEFWQFRPHVKGESYSSIDWRRSAREEKQMYIRDNELQASHTVWLWVDESPSMLYQSKDAIVSKQSRALVLAFALAELLSRSGERVGLIGVQPPIAHRHAAERLASALMVAEPQIEFASTNQIKDFSDVVLFSDFLPKGAATNKNNQPIAKSIKRLSQNRVRGHLVQIVDPAEEHFPYTGRIEFTDPETGNTLTSGSAAAMREDYTALFHAHTKNIENTAKQLGWMHTLHHTDRLASEALVNLHMKMSSGAANYTQNYSSKTGGQ